jgi:hypothetical protein
MTTLTIVKDDKFVAVDGEGLFLDEVVLEANVHAIQFDGANGYIEYNDDTPNKAITSISDYSTITDNHSVKKAANDKADSDAATAQATLEATYSWKREQEYPTIEECVHAILDDDLTALQVKRQAVKDKYPKP